jgi:hypothetical protein
MEESTAFRSHYARLSDERLLLIAADRENLVPDAVPVLESEMARRGLSGSHAAQFTESLRRTQTRDQIGDLGLGFRGWGKQFLGASRYAVESDGDFEGFDTTLWFFVSYVPLLPLRTVRIKRKARGQSVFWSFRDKRFYSAAGAPFAWFHVVLTYSILWLVLFTGFHLLRAWLVGRVPH